MNSQTPLSATQASIIALAATRPNHMLFPLPDDCRVVGGARNRVIAALLNRGLVDERLTDLVEATWRQNQDGQRFALVLTEAGLRVAGVTVLEPELAVAEVPLVVAPEANLPKRPGGKLGLVLRALDSTTGVSADALSQLTNWLPHTTRAALSRLRQRGFAIVRVSSDAGSVYRLLAAGEGEAHGA